MDHSPEVGSLISALAKCQSEFTHASKDSKNPAFGSSYADLASVIAAVRPVLSKHGIAFLQFDASDCERQIAYVTTSLIDLGENNRFRFELGPLPLVLAIVICLWSIEPMLSERQLQARWWRWFGVSGRGEDG